MAGQIILSDGVHLYGRSDVHISCTSFVHLCCLRCSYPFSSKYHYPFYHYTLPILLMPLYLYNLSYCNYIALFLFFLTFFSVIHLYIVHYNSTYCSCCDVVVSLYTFSFLASWIVNDMYINNGVHPPAVHKVQIMAIEKKAWATLTWYGRQSYIVHGVHGVHGVLVILPVDLWPGLHGATWPADEWPAYIFCCTLFA